MSAARGCDLLSSALRSRDYQHFCLWQQPRKGHLNVARAGRHVEDEVIQRRRPRYVAQELLEGLGQHQASPHEGGFLISDYEPGGYEMESVHGHRHDLAVVTGLESGFRRPQHSRHGESPDVGVE